MALKIYILKGQIAVSIDLNKVQKVVIYVQIESSNNMFPN
jgi:hypothetical protein